MKNLDQIRTIIKKSDAILITAGAGIGVDNGLSTYNYMDEFYKAYPILKAKNLAYSQIVSPHWFKDDPSLLWAFYGQRLDTYKKTVPHLGFQILLEFVKEKSDNYFIYTSNVDGQFQKASFNEDKIVEIHGSIHFLQCLEDCNDLVFSINNVDFEVDRNNFSILTFPKCPYCNSLVRPNILMFGDWKWNDSRTYFQEKKFQKWLKNIKNSNQRLLIIEISTGTVIPTIKKFGDKISNEYDKATLIRINPIEYHVYNKNSFGISKGALERIQTIFDYKER